MSRLLVLLQGRSVWQALCVPHCVHRFWYLWKRRLRLGLAMHSFMSSVQRSKFVCPLLPSYSYSRDIAGWSVNFNEDFILCLAQLMLMQIGSVRTQFLLYYNINYKILELRNRSDLLRSPMPSFMSSVQHSKFIYLSSPLPAFSLYEMLLDGQ